MEEKKNRGSEAADEEEALRAQLLSRFQSRSLGRFRAAGASGEDSASMGPDSIPMETRDPATPSCPVASMSRKRERRSENKGVAVDIGKQRSGVRSPGVHIEGSVAGSSHDIATSSSAHGGPGPMKRQRPETREAPMQQTTPVSNGQRRGTGIIKDVTSSSPSGLELQKLIESRVLMNASTTEQAPRPQNTEDVVGGRDDEDDEKIMDESYEYSPPPAVYPRDEPNATASMHSSSGALPLDLSRHSENQVPEPRYSQEVVEGAGSCSDTECMCSRHGPGSVPFGVGRRMKLTEGIRQAHMLWRREYKREAKEGDTTAAGLVGQMYLVGFGGVRRDVKKAYRWLRASAKQGNTTASNLLNQLRQQGITPKASTAEISFRLDNFSVTGRVQDQGTLLPQLQVPFDTFEGSNATASHGSILQSMYQTSSATTRGIPVGEGRRSTKKPVSKHHP